MKLAVFPLLKDIFPDEKEKDLHKFISELPSELIIQLLCYINGILTSDKSLKTQMMILGFLLRRQSIKLRTLILDRTLQFMDKEKQANVILFSAQFNLDFIHHELINYRKFEIEERDINPELELKFVKAYFLFMEIMGEENSKAYFQNTKKSSTRIENFRRGTWATFFSQVEAQSHQHPYSGAIRGISLLNYFLKKEELHVYARRYLDSYNFDSSWKYVLSVMSLLQIGWNMKNTKEGKYPFTIKSTPEYEKILNQFVLNISEYQKYYSKNKMNFSGFKARPLLKFSRHDTFFVVQWNLLSNKFHEGLLYDFYEGSGIKEVPQFKSFPDLKNYVASEISEHLLLKRVFQTLFHPKKYKLVFPSANGDGLPDAYIRKGNKVMIIEFKDAAFSAQVATSYSYEKIIKVINEKYNTDKKGTGQIVKHLIKLKKLIILEKESYEITTSKQLIIYPVIIFTDKFFGIEGVNDYLADELQLKISKQELEKEFHSIRRLTCFDFNQMLVYFKAFSESGSDLFSAIDKYNELIRKRKKRMLEVEDFEIVIKTQDSIENVLDDYLKVELSNHKGYFKKLVDIFDLIDGLPSSDETSFGEI